MNRNTEWECLVNKIKSNSPTHIEDSAKRAVSRMKIKRNIALFVKAPIASLFVCFVVFATLENTSGKFAKVIKSLPLMGRFGKLIILNPNIRSLYS